MAIGTGAAIIGSAVLGGVASKKAGDAAAAGAGNAVAESRRQFDTTRQDLLPYINTGTAALGQLARLYGLSPTQTQAPTPYRAADVDPRILGAFKGRRLPSYGTPATLSPTGSAPAAPATPTGPDMSVFFESPDYQFNLSEGQRAIDRSLAARGRALSGAGVREGVRYASGLASREFGSFYDRLANLAGIGQTGAAQSAAAGAASAGQVGAAQIAAGNARASAYQGINNSLQQGVGNLLLNRYLRDT